MLKFLTNSLFTDDRESVSVKSHCLCQYVTTVELLWPRPGGIKRCCLTSVCLSVTYIGPKSRTERPRKTKIGTEVAHVTRDSDPTLKVKGQLAGLGRGISWQPPAYSLLYPVFGGMTRPSHNCTTVHC